MAIHRHIPFFVRRPDHLVLYYPRLVLYNTASRQMKTKSRTNAISAGKMSVVMSQVINKNGISISSYGGYKKACKIH